MCRIGSFFRILSRPPSSGLRKPQHRAQKPPPPALKLPYSSLAYQTAEKGKQVGVDIDRRKVDQRDPSTSPIEDPSMQSPAAKERLEGSVTASNSSNLSLAAEERVARHVAMKRSDKVISLGSKRAESHIPSRPDTRNLLAQEITAVHAPSVPTSRGNATLHAPVLERPSRPKAIQRSRAQLRAQKHKANKKEKQAPISPAEYAKELLEKASSANKAKNPNAQFLEGKNIFYIGGDMRFAGERTRGRMDLIMKHGGNLIPTYDSTIVTHIVTDANKQPTLRALEYKRLSEIPGHIPTITWSWIQSGITRLNRLDKEDIKIKLEDVWLHAAFSERIDTTEHSKPVIQPTHSERLVKAGTSVVLTSSSSKDLSSNQHQPVSFLPQVLSSGHYISHDLIPESLLLTAPVDKGKGRQEVPAVSGGKPGTADPLEEFYAEAREAHKNNWFRFGGDDESDGDISPSDSGVVPPSSIPQQKRGWTCDSKEQQQMPCANQDVIEKLQELQELHKAKLGEEDHWRAFSYNKSIRAIRGYPKRIQSYSEARSIRGVGDKTALKIMEILQTGDLRRITYERTDDVEVTGLFQGIYGVGGPSKGRSTAFKWYCTGCRTLEDLRNQKGGVRLNSVQLIGLQYYQDINSRMPRSEAKSIFDLIKPLALSIDSKLFVEIMGSYRRGKLDCGDIDILITRPTNDDQTHSGILARLLPILHKEGIITEDLAIPENFAELECVYRGLCRLPREDSRRRRIDFLTVPWASRGAALLYYTFNRAMRLKANKMGYSLNQRGLFSGVVRDLKDSRIKTNEGTLVASETEQEIFRILDVPWQEPHERVRG
ncbi:DNA polymerase lambda [Leucoagaricus sp. SymC.cos]|nr:DNA polymerase lambda [Leucoagaricus sp. SymC.cos]